MYTQRWKETDTTECRINLQVSRLFDVDGALNSLHVYYIFCRETIEMKKLCVCVYVCFWWIRLIKWEAMEKIFIFRADYARCYRVDDNNNIFFFSRENEIIRGVRYNKRDWMKWNWCKMKYWFCLGTQICKSFIFVSWCAGCFIFSQSLLIKIERYEEVNIILSKEILIHIYD